MGRRQERERERGLREEKGLMQKVRPLRRWAGWGEGNGGTMLTVYTACFPPPPYAKSLRVPMQGGLTDRSFLVPAISETRHPQRASAAHLERGQRRNILFKVAQCSAVCLCSIQCSVQCCLFRNSFLKKRIGVQGE